MDLNNTKRRIRQLSLTAKPLDSLPFKLEQANAWLMYMLMHTHTLMSGNEPKRKKKKERKRE